MSGHRYGAFVCFKPATVSGGEFFIADAAKIARDLDSDVAQRIYDKKIRISVSNLDLDFLGGLDFDLGETAVRLKEPVMEAARVAVDKLVAPKFDMDLEMKYGADGKPMRMQAIEQVRGPRAVARISPKILRGRSGVKSGLQNSKRMFRNTRRSTKMRLVPSQVASPFNRHPKTGELLWFCNIHNHARYLRDRRPCTVPEVGMTEVYHGDLSPISSDDLDHINEISEKNIRTIPMQPGDVLLCDNYRVLHGRDIFDGDRYHAVSWFGGLVKDRPADYDDSNVNSKPGDMLNKMVNKFLVDSF